MNDYYFDVQNLRSAEKLGREKVKFIHNDETVATRNEYHRRLISIKQSIELDSVLKTAKESRVPDSRKFNLMCRKRKVRTTQNVTNSGNETEEQKR